MISSVTLAAAIGAPSGGDEADLGQVAALPAGQEGVQRVARARPCRSAATPPPSSTAADSGGGRRRRRGTGPEPAAAAGCVHA